MKINREKKERIINAIKSLNLSEKELDSISVGNMDKICMMANVRMLDLMIYLRYER